MIMAVLPAPEKVDLKLFRKILGVNELFFASENEFQDHFPGCAIGAMPPFGNLFGLRVISAQSLSQSETISFNSGVHTEIIQMLYADYNYIVGPEVMDFTYQLKVAA